MTNLEQIFNQSFHYCINNVWWN